MPKRLIAKPPRNLRERARADGSVRIWWEPPATARQLGHAPVELDEKRLTWSIREAERLNRALEAPSRGRAGRTIDALVDDFETSARFRRLARATQVSYRGFFAQIREKWGPEPAAGFTKPVMHAWYETLLTAKGEYVASALLRHASILFSHGERIGWLAPGSNPARGLGMVVPKGRRHTTGWAGFDLLVATADAIGRPWVGDGVVLSTMQGQRQTDVHEARRENFRRLSLDGADIWIWTLTRSKRGNDGVLVLHPEAAARIAPRLEAGPTTGPLLLDATGSPVTIDQFRAGFRDVRAAAVARAAKDGDAPLAAELRQLQFRDLRRTFGRLARDGGASKDDVADVLGNSAAANQQLGDVYMAPAIASVMRAVMAAQRPKPKDEGDE